jgi:hypothetical protein
MFYWIAAGLCVYFIISSAWGLAERTLFIKPAKPAASPPPAKAQPPARTDRSRDRAAKNGAPAWRRRLAAWWTNLLNQAKKK